MQGIGGFLERYKNFIPPRRAASRAVCTAIQEVVGIEVDEKKVSVSNGTARVALSGPEKSEIILRKKEVLAAAKQKIGDTLIDIQ